MEEAYEIHEGECPKCGHDFIHQRVCANFCQDGYFDQAEEDPINFMPGESEEECSECRGTGYEVWCPGCGENLSGVSGVFADDDYEHPEEQLT